MAEPRRLAAANPTVKALRRLVAHRDARAEAGLAVAEGERVVTDLLRTRPGAIDTVFSRGDVLPAAVAAALDTAPWVALDVAVFDSLAPTETPQPVLATVRCGPSPLAEVARGDVVFVLVGLADPGNAGTIVRLAEAVGAGVVCTEHCVDLTNPKAFRAAAGSLVRVPFAIAEPFEAAAAELRATGHRLVGTAMRAPTSYETYRWPRPVALVVGNEAHGLGDSVLASLDDIVCIPMEGELESLNAAIATGVVAFEVRRQLRGRS